MLILATAIPPHADLQPAWNRDTWRYLRFSVYFFLPHQGRDNLIFARPCEYISRSLELPPSALSGLLFLMIFRKRDALGSQLYTSDYCHHGMVLVG
jgi:hypothetical protein